MDAGSQWRVSSNEQTVQAYKLTFKGWVTSSQIAAMESGRRSWLHSMCSPTMQEPAPTPCDAHPRHPDHAEPSRHEIRIPGSTPEQVSVCLMAPLMLAPMALGCCRACLAFSALIRPDASHGHSNAANGGYGSLLVARCLCFCACLCHYVRGLYPSLSFCCCSFLSLRHRLTQPCTCTGESKTRSSRSCSQQRSDHMFLPSYIACSFPSSLNASPIGFSRLSLARRLSLTSPLPFSLLTSVSIHTCSLHYLCSLPMTLLSASCLITTLSNPWIVSLSLRLL